VEPETWVPDTTELEKPNTARIYDYLLGGYHNFEIDRSMAEKILLITPHLRLTAQISRAFVRRAVCYMVEQGIDQFLDIGSGIPTVGNVHEVAQSTNPAARVVYVDIDPVAVAHSQTMLSGNPQAAAIRGDLLWPDQILDHPDVRRLLDLSRPLGLLLTAVIHWIPDDGMAYASVRRLREAMTPGSFLALLHGVPEVQPADRERELAETAQRVATSKLRTPEEILSFFEGLELVEPGLVLTPLWHPEGPDDVGLDEPAMALALAGVGRKP
jgi:hypothetical protein